MRKSVFLSIVLAFLALVNLSLYSQQENEDEYYDDEEEYYDEIPLPSEWSHLWLDLGYGGSGVSAAIGYRYWFLGASLGVSGFSADIPRTASRYPGDNIDITSLPKKKYPSNVVCGDVYGFYDLKKITLYANFGYYSSIDTVLRFNPDNNAYYRDKPETNSGISWGFGAQYPLYLLEADNKIYEQLTLGAGYHSKFGIYLSLDYRWR